MGKVQRCKLFLDFIFEVLFFARAFKILFVSTIYVWLLAKKIVYT